ncbi:tRNA (adenosine(37)-N6)-threonylcarbamoyltransferase complex dimerization subunit type 1 TsaB [Novosphingobium album (ex Hu et al. 2023)]|uniref:tRNA (Adenosine(37)-N6)-threonylcarbamoyltransferase complex dimerization subunit type 1 TsaB n=1 Tax=Novosphingobium album (ex Hu et al. 2023) TaxID=2930093 RepID=A0ABT0AWJ1_9SPHN|nr:tRNA (adenosine(37)-N6)-threonylcarbamoyltransferase complex dimerization subunit type 1 TsaB [Novosphingobium album (ex Hu et al. 2023)]MCJ2177206.1 tRNA (adenosine(37)-N6)-threonylcarbamoyltransferase complex dimerization subunit type 1 TsaB [Novosphingobium album (ex Hu et al. 2023)]
MIDSATDACSVALFDDGAMIAGAFRLLGRGHAEALVPMIAALPGRGKAEHIVVSLGPGSFTGVRVGLAAARALALAWGASLAGYSSLALVAAMAREKHGNVPVGVTMTGGHGEWFVQGFDAQGLSSRDLASLRPDAASEETREDLVAGNQSEALVAARGHGTAMPAWPDARAFHRLPPGALIADVRPLYGRAPDARLPGGTAPASAA